MDNGNYANAYKEVLVVINNLVEEDYRKIPKEYIKFLEENSNPNHKFKYEKSKSFKEQNILEETKIFLLVLFEMFGATEDQKKAIKEFKAYYNIMIEEEKRKKYNPDNIFKKKY